MQNTRPQPLTTKQITAYALLALSFSVLGWWFGGRSSETAADLPAPPPVDRLEAERGRTKILQRQAPDLTYHEDSPDFPGQNRIHYTVPRRSQKLSSGKFSRSDKQDVIAVNLVNAPLTGNSHFSAASAKGSAPLPQNSAPASKSSISRRAPAQRQRSSSNVQSASASPNNKTAALAPPTDAQAGLEYPPSGITTKIGFSQAWLNSKNSVAYIYDDSKQKIAGVYSQIGSDIWAGTAAAAKAGPTDSRFAEYHQLKRLQLVLTTAQEQQAPPLASAPPLKNAFLATIGPASNPGMYSTAKVTGRLYGGMFCLICPVDQELGALPLVNDRGELAGLVAGTIPSYRGHNHFLGLDASLLYAWTNKNKTAGSSEIYDLNFQISDQLETALKRLENKRFSRRTDQNEHLAVPGQRLGKFSLGASAQEITDALGEGGESGRDLLGHKLSASDPLFTYISYPDRGLAFNFYDGRLVAVETTSNRYATPKGLAVGSSLEGGSQHELSRRKCSGYTVSDRPLVVIQGLEAELNSVGLVELLRITI